MRRDTRHAAAAPTDDWLASQCRRIDTAGRDLAEALGQVNLRIEQARKGTLGRRQRITEAQLRQAEAACKTLHDVQVAVQNTLFDCEHELRSLREREVSPAELLVEGERLIRQYRFLRRRARVIDGLLAYLPVVSAQATACLERLRRIRGGALAPGPMTAPDCGFALVALETLCEGEAGS